MILVIYSKFMLGPILLFLFFVIFTCLEIATYDNTLHLFTDKILITNPLKKSKVYFFIDIKEVIVYGNLRPPNRGSIYFLTIIFHEKEKDNYFYKTASPHFASYRQKEMQLIYEELLKRNVPCKMV
ncbi:MAG: hypothetical protein IT244_10170 [Bacteroidia bacterium]|nr:hypothetical protein [Bacteroidia bacterium]